MRALEGPSATLGGAPRWLLRLTLAALAASVPLLVAPSGDVATSLDDVTIRAERSVATVAALPAHSALQRASDRTKPPAAVGALPSVVLGGVIAFVVALGLRTSMFVSAVSGQGISSRDPPILRLT